MRFADDDGNLYYTEDDTLYVKGKKLEFLRKIGRLTTNITTGKCNLVISRQAQEKTNFGWMVSEAPLRVLDINYLVLMVDNKDMYLLEWERVKPHRRSWTFTPNNGMEKQVVIPTEHWDAVKVDTGIVVNG